MGNYRFRFSDMMPNAWFYKLRDIGSNRRRRSPAAAKKQPPPPPPPPPSSARKSYYFTRQFNSPNSPRKSSFRSHQTKPHRKSSSSSSAPCNCRAAALKSSDYSASSSSYTSPEDSLRSDGILATESLNRIPAGAADDDIVIDVDSKSLAAEFEKLELSELDLPPIITKPAEFSGVTEEKKMKKKKERVERSNSNRRHVTSPGLRLRVNSPRIGGRRVGGGRRSVSSSCRRSLSESVAIAKASTDPMKDFRESMVEMIVENNIKASKDLEDLLACYLTLNSDEYHDLIIKVFKQIWVDLSQTNSSFQ